MASERRPWEEGEQWIAPKADARRREEIRGGGSAPAAHLAPDARPMGVGQAAARHRRGVSLRTPRPWRWRPLRAVVSIGNGGTLGSRIREVAPRRHRLLPSGEGEGEGETQIGARSTAGGHHGTVVAHLHHHGKQQRSRRRRPPRRVDRGHAMASSSATAASSSGKGSAGLLQGDACYLLVLLFSTLI